MGNIFDQDETATASANDPGGIDRLAAEVSRRTDLSEDICRQLLLNGWSFKQELGKPDRWEKMY